MNHKQLVLMGSVGAAVLVGIGAGIFLLKSAGNTPGVPNYTGSEQQTSDVQASPATGRLEIVKKNLDKTSLDYDIVFLDSSPAENVAGFSLHLLISPPAGSAGSSTITAGPMFVKGSFITPLKTIKNTSTSTEITFAAAVTSPGANVILNNGDVIASVHLAGAKKGDYKLAFDKAQTKVLTGIKSTNIIGTLTDTTLTVE